jgi:hypothetical protein
MNEKKDLAQKMKALGYSLCVFGFGNDHDSEQLKMIANAGEGTFTFVQEDNMVTDAFGGSIGGQQSLVATDIQLTITLSDENPSSQLQQIFCGKYTNQISADGKSAEVKFSNMLAGEVRDVLLKVKISSISTESESLRLLTAEAKFKSMDGKAGQAVSDRGSVSYVDSEPYTAVCKIARIGSDVPLPEANEEVDVQRNRALYVATVEEANEEAKKGNFGAAKAKLNLFKENAKQSKAFANNNSVLQAIIDDADDTSEQMKDSQVYGGFGGAANVASNVDMWTNQRQMYSAPTKKAFYQTSMSSARQENANIFSKPK